MALAPCRPGASPATKEAFRKKLRDGELNDKEIEIEVQSGGGMPLFDIPGMPGAQMGAISIGDIFGKVGGGLSSLDATELGGVAIKAALERAGVEPEQVDWFEEGAQADQHQAGAGEDPEENALIAGNHCDTCAG